MSAARAVPPQHDTRICGVAFDGGQLQITLMNRRVFELDLAGFPTLARASFEDRMGWLVVDGGHGLAWPMLGLGVDSREGLINSRRLVHAG